MTTGRSYVDAAASRVLPPLGFSRRRGLYRIDLTDEAWGAIGLNTGNIARGTVSVHPSVSVTHTPIEQEIIARQGGEGDLDNATIVAHLFELGGRGEIPDLIVDGEASARVVTESIASQLRRYGIPWMREMAKMEGLAAGLERHLQIEPEFRRPIAYREIGRPDLALASIDRTLDDWNEMPDSGTVGRFRRFARSIRPELEVMLIDHDARPTRKHAD